MSVIARRVAPPVARRDISGYPWANGQTVPSPLQTSSPMYGYAASDAFKVAASIACIGLRSGALLQMPLKGYTEADGYSRLMPVQPDLLAAPSRVVKPSIWKAQLSISRDAWGYAAGLIVAVDASGYPSKVNWVVPDKLTARLSGSALDWRLDGQPIDAMSVFHIPSRWVTPGNPLGMSPLENSGLIGLAKRVQEYGRDWFDRGAVPSAIIYSDEVLTSEQADGILARVASRWKRRQPGILGAGLKYEQVAVKANESQFLETATRAAADVAISFNMPPEKIGAAIAGQSITYANRDQQVQQYLIDCINPDLVVIQEYVEGHMRPGTFPRWQTAALLRSDLKTRYESYRLGIAAQFIHPDEARALEDLPPLTREQIATMPVVSHSTPTTEVPQ